MADKPQNLELANYFSALHELRHAAQELLQGKAEALEPMLNEMEKLAGNVELNGAGDIFLKTVFMETTRKFVEKLSETSAETLAALKVPAETQLPVDKFVEVQKAIIAKKNESAALSAGGAETKGRAVKEQEDSLEVRALKAEISGWIEKRLPTAAEKATAKKQLNEADALSVYYDKKIKKVMVKFGDFTAKFGVSTKDSRIAEGLSTYGGLAQFYKTPEEGYKFTEQLLKHKVSTAAPDGKRYDTGIGKKASNLKKQQSNKEKSQQSKLQKLEKEITLLQNKLQMSWRSMLQSADGAAVYRDLRNPEGLLCSAGGVGKVKADMQLAAGILASDTLWAFYQKNENNNDTYNTESDYAKLAEVCFADWEMQDRLQKAYQSYQVGGDKTIPVFFATLKKDAEVWNLPRGAAEQYMLDEAFKFAVPFLSGQRLDADKFAFMNKLMENSGLRIRLTTHTITEKCDGKLNDEIHKTHDKVKQYKKQLTGLLYFMGEKLAAHKSTSDLLFAAELSGAFKEVCKLGDISGDWKRFIDNPDNLKKARETYEILNAEYGKKAAGIAGTLLNGGEVKGNSLHHVTYAYYASLMGSDVQKLVKEFNCPANTVEVLPPVHPAFEDVHKDLEHRFNVGNGGSVLVERGGKIGLSTTNTCKVGDVLQIPVLERKGKDGKFSALMRTDTVFITASGRMVGEPVFGGEGNSKSQFIAKINDGRG